MPVDPHPFVIAAAFAPALQPLQAVLFLLLLAAIAFYDLRFREIPDRWQLALAATTLLCFAPTNLLGVFGAVPYLAMALALDGMGGGDIKLAAAIGVVLGLPASLTASILGLGSFVLYAALDRMGRRHSGSTESVGYPMGPFLALGAATAYLLKMGGRIL